MDAWLTFAGPKAQAMPRRPLSPDGEAITKLHGRIGVEAVESANRSAETQVHATLALAAVTAAAKSADADSRRAWNTATAEPSGGRTEVRNGLEAANHSQGERIRRVEKLRETLPPKAGHASARAPASSKRPLFRSPPLDAEMDP
jgi:hypothetical protein